MPISAFLQILEQVEDLRLNRHIQRRDRLITNDQFRMAHQRPRDPNPLPLTATKGVRVAAHVSLLETDELERVANHSSAASPFRDVVIKQRLQHNITYPHTRIQRRAGVLEDHMEVPPDRS